MPENYVFRLWRSLSDKWGVLPVLYPRCHQMSALTVSANTWPTGPASQIKLQRKVDLENYAGHKEWV